MSRVPRKKKKEYKKIWEERLGRKLKIERKSISKEDGVWGCIVYPSKDE